MSAADEADKKRSEAIDRTLAAEGLSRNNEIKLLLLGENHWQLFGVMCFVAGRASEAERMN